MNQGLSIYLDLIRFGAAFSVFLFHMGYGKLSGDPVFAKFVQFGTPAVLIFFVLSGFVIAYVNKTREKTVRDYTIARMSRLFSVTVPALLLTAICDTVGNAVRPDLYPIPLTVTAFIRDLTFTNNLWFGASSFGSIISYWSLGFEVPYYILFAIGAFARGWLATASILLVAALFGTEVMWMFPVWLIGCVCFSTTINIEIDRPMLGWPLFIAPIIVVVWMIHNDMLLPIAHGLGYDWSRLLLAYAVGVLFGINIIGARLISGHLLMALKPLSKMIQWLAGTTFTLYLLHVPFAFVIRSYLPRDIPSWETGIILVPGVLTAVFITAEFSERRKKWWRMMFERLLPKRQYLTKLLCRGKLPVI